jgi:hypothetical protein
VHLEVDFLFRSNRCSECIDFSQRTRRQIPAIASNLVRSAEHDRLGQGKRVSRSWKLLARVMAKVLVSCSEEVATPRKGKFNEKPASEARGNALSMEELLSSTQTETSWRQGGCMRTLRRKKVNVPSGSALSIPNLDRIATCEIGISCGNNRANAGECPSPSWRIYHPNGGNSAIRIPQQIQGTAANLVWHIKRDSLGQGENAQ